MAGATVTVDIREVSAALARLIRASGSMRPYFLELGEELTESTKARFAAQVDPQGRPWQPLSQRYLRSARKRKSRGPNLILTLTGALRGTISYRADSSSVTIGTNRVYGATHQFGRGPIPARPFLGLSQSDRSTVLQTALDYFERALHS